MKFINSVQKGTFMYILFLFVNNNSFASINFKSISFSEAKSIALKEKKMVFIDAYATWCGPCKWMASNVFSNDTIGVYFSEHFVSIKIDMETDAGIEINELFSITAYPTLLAVSPDGQLIRKQVGALDIDELLLWADYCAHPENSPYFISLKKYESGKKDLEFLLDFLVLSYNEEKPYDHLIPEIFTIMPTDSLKTASGFMIFQAFPQEYNSVHTKYFFQNFDYFYTFYPEDALSTYEKIIEIAMEENTAPKSKIIEQVNINFSDFPEVLDYFNDIINSN